MCIVFDSYIQNDIIGMVYNSPVVAPNYSWQMWITFSWPDGILLENTKGKPDGDSRMDFPSHLFVVVNFAVLLILCSVYYFTGFIVSDSVIQGSVADFWELVASYLSVANRLRKKFHCQKWRSYKAGKALCAHSCKGREKITHPMPTEGLLQPNPEAAMIRHPSTETHPPSSVPSFLQRMCQSDILKLKVSCC